jgi:peptidoglycan/LPS O-acetylase OafA/YrhL
VGYIRLLLALVVVCAHLPAPSYYGAALDATLFSVGPIAAVNLFFIISGFYMAMVYNRYPNALAFWTSRALRLYPVYWLTIFGLYVALQLFHSPSIGGYINAGIWNHFSWRTIVWGGANLSFFGLDCGFRRSRPGITG